MKKRPKRKKPSHRWLVVLLTVLAFVAGSAAGYWLTRVFERPCFNLLVQEESGTIT